MFRNLFGVGLVALVAVACGSAPGEVSPGEREQAVCFAAPPSVLCKTRVTIYCDAPTVAPQETGCDATASDTAAAEGQEWCCNPLGPDQKPL